MYMFKMKTAKTKMYSNENDHCKNQHQHQQGTVGCQVNCKCENIWERCCFWRPRVQNVSLK